MRIDLLTKAVGEILSARCGKTITVRIEDVTGKGKEDGSAGCSEAD